MCITIPEMVGLAPKWVRLAPNGTNPGLFQIRFQCIWRGCAKCTEIWSQKAPDLSHLGAIWTTLKPNLPSLITIQCPTTRSVRQSVESEVIPLDTSAWITSPVVSLDQLLSLHSQCFIMYCFQLNSSFFFSSSNYYVQEKMISKSNTGLKNTSGISRSKDLALIFIKYNSSSTNDFPLEEDVDMELEFG